ncbi:MAG: GNAT family protein [Coriobacteriia bacterium]|nr:GNAT family protein [Coriobacteriia bacterium]
MIRGESIHLTPLDRTNAERVRAWINDPEVNQYLLTGQVPVTPEQEAAFYERAEKDWNEGTGYIFEIHAEGVEGLIGHCGLHKVDMRHRSAELGIFIGVLDQQNKGRGRDAIMTLVRFGFDTLGLNRIEIRSQADNDRGMHLYPKLGFTPVGRLREATYTHGNFQDEAIFDMLESEWRALRDGAGS